ncbi:MAG: flagellar basal body-associated FliL family protein [Thermoleophilia bacterium]
MALTAKKRNMIIGIVAVLVIAAIAGAFFLGRSGSDDQATTGTTPTNTGTTAVAAVSIMEQHATPDPATVGGTVTFIVRVSGNASSVLLIDEQPPAACDFAGQTTRET